MEQFTAIVKKKTNPELLKMVYEFTVWSPEMLQAVQNELERRDALPKDIDEKKQELIRKEDEELSTGKEASAMGVIAGWICVTGLLGIYIGYQYGYSKRRSVYTQKVYYTYNESSRKNGQTLFFASTILSVVAIIYTIAKVMS